MTQRGAVTVAWAPDAEAVQRRFVKGVERDVQKAKAVTALTVLSALIVETPVDTGRLRGGWTVGAGIIPSGGDPGKRAKGSRSLPPPSVRGVGSALSSVPVEAPIYVANNVAYAGHVNDRHPTKAGFVYAAVSNAITLLRTRKVLS